MLLAAHNAPRPTVGRKAERNLVIDARKRVKDQRITIRSNKKKRTLP
jgi:hypothetical protein